MRNLDAMIQQGDFDDLRVVGQQFESNLTSGIRPILGERAGQLGLEFHQLLHPPQRLRPQFGKQFRLFIGQVHRRIFAQRSFELDAVGHRGALAQSELPGGLAPRELPVGDPAFNDQCRGGVGDLFALVCHPISSNSLDHSALVDTPGRQGPPQRCPAPDILVFAMRSSRGRRLLRTVHWLKGRTHGRVQGTLRRGRWR